MHCWNCGTSLARPETVAYCVKCGVRVVQSCPYDDCGAAVRPGLDVSCPTCGRPLLECSTTRKLHTLHDVASTEGGRLREPAPSSYTRGVSNSRSGSVTLPGRGHDEGCAVGEILLPPGPGRYATWAISRHGRVYLGKDNGRIVALDEATLTPLGDPWPPTPVVQDDLATARLHAARRYIHYCTNEGVLGVVCAETGNGLCRTDTQLRACNHLWTDEAVHVVGTNNHGDSVYVTYVVDNGAGAVQLREVQRWTVDPANRQAGGSLLCADGEDVFFRPGGVPHRIYRASALPDPNTGPEPIFENNGAIQFTVICLCCTTDWLVYVSQALDRVTVIGRPRDDLGQEELRHAEGVGIRVASPNAVVAWDDRVAIVGDSTGEGVRNAVAVVNLGAGANGVDRVGQLDPGYQACQAFHIRHGDLDDVGVLSRPTQFNNARLDVFPVGRGAVPLVRPFLGRPESVLITRGRTLAVCMRTNGDQYLDVRRLDLGPQ